MSHIREYTYTCIKRLFTSELHILKINMSSSDSFHPGRAVPDDSYARKDGQSIEKQLEALTAQLREFVQKNEDLKEENEDLKGKLSQLEQKCLSGAFGGQDHGRTRDEMQERYKVEISKISEHLKAKEVEVERLKKRLAAISERKVKQDQRRTENTLSINRQSDLERDYIHAFKDGKRLEAIEVIEKRLSNKSPKLDLVQASRLACLILEASYECAVNAKIKFESFSSSVMSSVIHKAPLVAFLETKKLFSAEFFSSGSSSPTGSVEVEEALKELMVHVKETSGEHELNKLVDVVRSEVITKWQKQLRASKQTAVLPPFNEGLVKSGLSNYIQYCCRFSWRIVTQVPPLKISYQDTNFDLRIHEENASLAGNKKRTSKIKSFLWPTLLDFEGRVIAKGEVLLSQAEY